MAESSGREGIGPLNLRHSIAPRVLDNSVLMATLVSTSRFSVRVAPPRPTSTRTPSSSILTTFVWRDAGARVFLAGSFDDWRKHEMTFVPDVGYHILVTELPPGEYVYRFVVDGRWRIADNDPNLREDQFGELSHFLEISHDAVLQATPKRFSTAAVAHADAELAAPADVAVDEGESDTETEESDDEEEVENVPEAPLPPRKRGDATYIEDYDDDACGELDLQADVFEAMKDVAETTNVKQATLASTSGPPSQSSWIERKKGGMFKRKPGVRVLRKVWGMLFGDGREDDDGHDQGENSANHMVPTRNQKTHGLAENEQAKKGLKVWFPNERNFPSKSAKGRKVDAEETKEVIDVGQKALKLHQVEDNANTRQMLGKTLFAQGKYDAALALFSLSVKLREDNGLKYAKTTAIAHTDVASAFIHLEDLKNAEKHLRMALAIYNKNTFSGGRAQLGDVHCFLGVIGDMKGELNDAELAYRAAIDLYEKSRSTDENPNYATAKENLNSNLKRQQLVSRRQQPPPGPKKSQPAPESVGLGQHVESNPAVTLESARSVDTLNSARHRPPPPPTKRAPPPRPLEPSRPAPQISDATIDKPRRGILKPPNQAHTEYVQEAKKDPKALARPSVESVETVSTQRKSKEPKTWKDLADTARASMPKSPPNEDVSDSEEDATPPAGSYEEMCLSWHRDARKLLFEGKYSEAIDLYTLAVYTRKRHGPWTTRGNAETLVENARALFATKELGESVKSLRDAIGILEQLDRKKNGLFLGEVWGNLGSVLDRLGNHRMEALTAHCAGMVSYGRAGMSNDDPKWLKAWKSLCVNLKMTTGAGAKTTDEVWQMIDLQIRGVTPMAKVANVILHA